MWWFDPITLIRKYWLRIIATENTALMAEGRGWWCEIGLSLSRLSLDFLPLMRLQCEPDLCLVNTVQISNIWYNESGGQRERGKGLSWRSYFYERGEGKDPSCVPSCERMEVFDVWLTLELALLRELLWFPPITEHWLGLSADNWRDFLTWSSELPQVEPQSTIPQWGLTGVYQSRLIFCSVTYLNNKWLIMLDKNANILQNNPSRK